MILNLDEFWEKFSGLISEFFIFYFLNIQKILIFKNYFFLFNRLQAVNNMDYLMMQLFSVILINFIKLTRQRLKCGVKYLNRLLFIFYFKFLNQVPNSVLWLLRFPYHGEQHVIRFCAQRGINTKKIIFSNVAAKGSFYIFKLKNFLGFFFENF